jgi:hypothetical protein
VSSDGGVEAARYDLEMSYTDRRMKYQLEVRNEMSYRPVLILGKEDRNEIGAVGVGE